ncbi:MAG: DUF885 domain-containing protein [Actinomycetes bacterium]
MTDVTAAAGRPGGESAAEPAIRAFLDDLLADNPVLATGLGLTGGADRLPSWSAQALARRVGMLHRHERALLPLLADHEPATAVDAFAGLQIARRQLRDLELCRVQHRRPGAYLDVLFGLLPLLMRELGTPAARVEALAGRLRAAPGLLEEARDNLEPGLPAALVTAGLDQVDGLLELAGPTVRAFAADAGYGGALDGASRTACTALTAFREHLHDVLAPGAAAQCGAGRAVLDDILRWEHVLDDAPEELARYGREVLSATKAAMEKVAADLGHGGAAAAVAALQADHPAADDLVAAYRRAVEAARAHVVARGVVTMPEGEELMVMATPTFLRSMLPFAAYDQPGPFDARQLGFYYVTPPRDGLEGPRLEAALRSHPRASLATTGVHEAYPGHHVQLVSANRATTLARRIAHIPNGGNILVEGWAFYCEELMERQGLLADPATRLMRLNDQVWRACRVVIDVELHLGIMDLPAAIDYLCAEAHMNRYEAELECRRYAGEPGQAMSYLLGKREVQRLAALYGRRRGGSPRDFHDELLSWGCLPPAVIAWGMGLAPPPAAARVTS